MLKLSVDKKLECGRMHSFILTCDNTIQENVLQLP